MEKAIKFEIKRQTELLESGEIWVQQTRGWDENIGETIMQRTKENSEDYRYFPEPDIPPFHPEQIASDIQLLELPQTKRVRFRDEYGFSYSDAKILTDDETLANFTENVMSELVDWLYSLPETNKDSDQIKEEKNNKLARLAGGWITSKLLGILHDRKIDIRLLKISPENFAELITLIYSNRVNATNGLKILTEMINAGANIDPTHIMEEKGYGQVSDTAKISAVVAEVIRSYPKQVEQFKAGKEPILQFLKGMVMKATEGSADPTVAESLLRKKLS